MRAGCKPAGGRASNGLGGSVKRALPRMRSPRPRKTAARAGDSEWDTPPPRQHMRVQWLLSAQALCIYVPRLALPVLVAFLAEERSFSEAARARLLGAFFPGYMITMVPLGWAAQRFGPKLILQLGNVGTAASMLLLPAMASAGPMAASACCFLLGLLQGPFVPAHNEMKRLWVPEGPGKPMSLMIIGLGNRIGGALASVLTPVLASKLGWRWVCYVYGACVAAYAAVWELCVSNGPVVRAEPDPVEEELAAITSENRRFSRAGMSWQAVRARAERRARVRAKVAKGRPFEPRIFRARAAQVIMLMHFNCNFTEITLLQWAPIYLKEVLHVPLGRIGTYLAASAIVEQIANVGAASLEAALLRGGWDVLCLRRRSTMLASGLQSLSLLLFGLAPGPVLATVGMCGVRVGDALHSSGCVRACVHMFSVSGTANSLACRNPCESLNLPPPPPASHPSTTEICFVRI